MQVELKSGHFVTSDGVELHYLEAGSGTPLVFVPGWTMPAWIWEPQLKYFSGTHRVVGLDPRGQGRSEKPTEGYHAKRRARDIYELLAHVGGDPAIIVGWSLAVQEVLVCAREFGAERFRAVVLVDHPVVVDPEFARAITGERIKVLQENREAWTRSFVEDMYRRRPSDEYLEAVTQAALSTPTTAAALMMANLYFLGPLDLGPALDALGRPVLFVYSPLEWAVAAAEAVRAGWPKMAIEVIDGTSHALFVDKPEEFNRVLEVFLTSLPQ